MSLTIRPAQIDDADQVLSLIRGLAEYEKLSHEVVATREKIIETLFAENRYAECLLAEKETAAGNTTVGFALFFHNYSTFLAQPGIYLEDLFVLPEHRSEGIGKLLLKTVAKIAVERNCGRMEWSVLDWNTPAIDFYKSLGAVPMQQWITNRLTGDALQEVATFNNNS